jgi:hypothetical protein
MLPVARSSSWESVLGALAGLAAALRPHGGTAPSDAALGVARSRARDLLRKLRHHLYEETVIVQALEEASPASSEAAAQMTRSHRMLRELAHELCAWLRAKDLAGAWTVSRSFLAYFLDSKSRDQRVLSLAMHAMDSADALRFVDAFFGRMLFDLAAGERKAPPGGRPDGLQSLYVRLLNHLEVRSSDSQFPKVHHEHPCRR